MSLILRIVGKNVRQHHVLIKCFHNKPARSMESLLRLSRTLPKSIPRPTNLTIQRLSSSHAHDHAKIWVLEKYLSAALLAVIPAALIYPNPVLDYLLAFSLVIHTHWGFEAIVVDYIRPSLFGPIIPKVALASIYLLSMVALAGLFYMNYSDVGVSTAIKMFAKKHIDQ